MENNNEHKLVYRNDFGWSLSRQISVTAVQSNLLFTLLYKFRDSVDSQPIVMTFSELRKLSGFKLSSRDSLKTAFEDLGNALSSKFEVENASGTEKIAAVLFPTYKINMANSTVTVKVNEDLYPLFKSLSREFTCISLTQYVELKSLYSKHLYRMLSQYRDTGVVYVSFQNCCQFLQISEETKPAEQMRIVKKAIEEITEKGIFSNLTLEPVYDDSYAGKGKKPIKTLIFRFDATPLLGAQNQPKTLEDKGGFTCPECGEKLIEKVINGSNCWCHEDGWRDGAKCKKIYNSVSEIKGYSETADRVTTASERSGESKSLNDIIAGIALNFRPADESDNKNT